MVGFSAPTADALPYRSSSLVKGREGKGRLSTTHSLPHAEQVTGEGVWEGTLVPRTVAALGREGVQ